MTAWNKSELDLVLENIELSASDVYAKYCKRFGEDSRSYDSVQKKLRGLKDDPPVQQVWTPAHPVPLAPAPIAMPVSVLDSPTHLVQDEIEAWLHAAADSIVGKPVIPGKGDGQSLVIVLSDNHFGKKTSEFNLEVARQRVLSMVPGILDAHPNAQERVDEVVLVLAGDEVEGEDIYANQNGGLECPVILQAQAAASAYWQLALNLLSTFQCSVRLHVCPGNHGRMSKTADVRSNWDNVVYMMLATLSQEHPELDITVDLNFEEFALFEVKGKLGCAYHYGTKHLGTPAMTQKMAGWIMAKGIEFLVHGHWHHWGVETYMGRPMMHNGCMCGPDDLAEKMAVEEPPRQGYFFVEEGKPIRVWGFCEW